MRAGVPGCAATCLAEPACGHTAAEGTLLLGCEGGACSGCMEWQSLACTFEQQISSMMPEQVSAQVGAGPGRVTSLPASHRAAQTHLRAGALTTMRCGGAAARTHRSRAPHRTLWCIRRPPRPSARSARSAGGGSLQDRGKAGVSAERRQSPCVSSRRQPPTGCSPVQPWTPQGAGMRAKQHGLLAPDRGRHGRRSPTAAAAALRASSSGWVSADRVN